MRIDEMGLNRVCVFCGSSIGRDPIYSASARKLGGVIGKGGKVLVYGGVLSTMGHFGQRLQYLPISTRSCPK